MDENTLYLDFPGNEVKPMFGWDQVCLDSLIEYEILVNFAFVQYLWAFSKEIMDVIYFYKFIVYCDIISSSEKLSNHRAILNFLLHLQNIVGTS